MTTGGAVPMSDSADASAIAPTPNSATESEQMEVTSGTTVAPKSPHDGAVATSSAFPNAASVAVAAAPLATLPAIRRVTLPPQNPVLAAAARSHRLGRHSSKFGTVNYSIDEMHRLIDKVRAVLPVASEDWLHVAYQFNYMRPESIPYREVESLKRKFKKMYCSRATIGGKLPEYVQDAKDLRRLINQRGERAQIQMEHTNSDTQSDVDVQDASSTMTNTATPSASVDDPHERGGAPDTSTLSTERVVSGEPSAISAATVADVVQAEGYGSTEATLGSSSASTGGGDDTREITARLRLMEEEYHRSMATKRASGSAETRASGSSSGAGPALYPPDAMSFSAQLAATTPLAGSMYTPPSATSLSTTGGGCTNGSDSTAGIINLLKHSIERKRRTIEEQMLSESERVRKERKKRRMEQVLYTIHRDNEAGGGGGAAGSAATSMLPAELDGSSSNGSTRMAFSMHHPGGLGGSVSDQNPDPDSSLGVMEIVLQYMVTQQQEANRRAQYEDEQRRHEREQRERRRREKEAQRRQDKHEMMVVMAALLQEGFPEELRHYLEPGNRGGNHGGEQKQEEQGQHYTSEAQTQVAVAIENQTPTQIPTNSQAPLAAEAPTTAAAIAASLAASVESALL